MNVKEAYWYEKFLKEMKRRFRYQLLQSNGNPGQKKEAKETIPLIDIRLKMFQENYASGLRGNDNLSDS